MSPSGANLLQQGAGSLNVDGAVAIAKALRTDLNTAIAAGSLAAGSSMLGGSKTFPLQRSTINGESFNWSKLATVGGNRLVSGNELFTRYQPLWDPRTTWVGQSVRQRTVSYWSGSGIAANTFAKSFSETAASNQALLTAGVVRADALLGASSWSGKSGAFMPTATLSAWLASGSGIVLSEGIVLSDGIVLSEGVVLSEGIVLSEGVVLSKGSTVRDSAVVGEP